MATGLLTFVLLLGHQLSHHGLDDANVAVEEATERSPEKGNPNVGGKSNHDHAEHGAEATQKQDWLAADSIRHPAPVHAHEGFGKGEGRDEEASVKRGIVLATDFEPLDQSPGVGKD